MSSPPPPSQLTLCVQDNNEEWTIVHKGALTDRGFIETEFSKRFHLGLAGLSPPDDSVHQDASQLRRSSPTRVMGSLRRKLYSSLKGRDSELADFPLVVDPERIVIEGELLTYWPGVSVPSLSC